MDKETDRDLFMYCEDDSHAVLHWRKSPAPHILAGSRAGTLQKDNGYRKVIIRGRKYYEHTLIWLYHFGEIPEQIDHVNNVRDDNCIGNLRACSQAENNANMVKRKDNTSGHRGVVQHTTGWIVRCGRKYVGWFKQFDDAVAAYQDASRKEWGDFARSDI